MEEFHRKSSGKKECIVGKKNVKKKRRKKENGWKRENVVLYSCTVPTPSL